MSIQLAALCVAGRRGRAACPKAKGNISALLPVASLQASLFVCIAVFPCSLTGNYNAAPRRPSNGGGARGGSRGGKEAAGEGGANGNGGSGSNGSNGSGSGADEAGSSLVPHGPGAQFREVGLK